VSCHWSELPGPGGALIVARSETSAIVIRPPSGIAIDMGAHDDAGAASSGKRCAPPSHSPKSR